MWYLYKLITILCFLFDDGVGIRVDYRHRQFFLQHRIVIGHSRAAPDGLVQVVHGDPAHERSTM